MNQHGFAVLFETTVWPMDYQPNFIYLERGNKIFAYIPKGKTPVYFNKPMVWNRKHRSFMKLSGMPFDINQVNAQ